VIEGDTPGTGVELLGFCGCGGAWVVLDVEWVFVWIMVRGERGFFEGGVLRV
jgi:ribosomal silencing factor RsfS